MYIKENPTVVTPMNPPFKCFLRDVPEQTTEQDIRDFFSDCKVNRISFTFLSFFFHFSFSFFCHNHCDHLDSSSPT